MGYDELIGIMIGMMIIPIGGTNIWDIYTIEVDELIFMGYD